MSCAFRIISWFWTESLLTRIAELMTTQHIKVLLTCRIAGGTTVILVIILFNLSSFLPRTLAIYYHPVSSRTTKDDQDMIHQLTVPWSQKHYTCFEQHMMRYPKCVEMYFNICVRAGCLGERGAEHEQVSIWFCIYLYCCDGLSIGITIPQSVQIRRSTYLSRLTVQRD